MFLSANQKTHHAGVVSYQLSSAFISPPTSSSSLLASSSVPPRDTSRPSQSGLSGFLSEPSYVRRLSHVLLPVPKRTSSSSTSIMWPSRSVNNQHPASGDEKKHLGCSLNRTHTKPRGISLIKLSICLRLRVFAMPTHTHTHIYPVFVLQQHTKTDGQRDVCLAPGNPNGQSTDMMREGWKKSQSP